MDPLKTGSKMLMFSIVLFGFCFVIFILSMNYWQNKFDILKEEMTEIKEKFVQENAEMKDKMAIILGENNKTREEMSRRNDEFIGKLAEQKQEFEGKIRAMEGQFKELLANLTEQNDESENEFVNKLNFNSYKWNAVENYGRNLNISEDGLNVKYLPSFKGKVNNVFTNLPIPKFNISAKNPSILFYYEVKILAETNYADIAIGYCDKEFSSKRTILGAVNNSIGLYGKSAISIDGFQIDFENSSGNFENFDVIGLGIVYSPRISKVECYGTLNGQLLGKAELPLKYATLNCSLQPNCFPPCKHSKQILAMTNSSSTHLNFSKKCINDKKNCTEIKQHILNDFFCISLS